MVSTLSPEGIRACLQSVGVDISIDSFPLANFCTSPITIYFSYLAATLVNLTNCDADAAWDSIQTSGDVSDLVVVIPRLQLPSIDPNEFASELRMRHRSYVSSLTGLPQFPVNALFDDPFNDDCNLRFNFKLATLGRLLIPYILDRGPQYGNSTSLEAEQPAELGSGRRKALVEFSSPNIGKEFNGGHMRSTIIGMSIASLYESMGWDVIRMNYLGDWGQHIGLLMAGWFKFGSEESFSEDPLRHLLDISHRVDSLYKSQRDDGPAADGTITNDEKDRWCKRLEEGCPDVITLWKRFRDASVSGYIDNYARLDLKFDDYSGESAFSPETITEIESSLKEKGVYKESAGAWVINFNELSPKGLPTAILRYRNGSTTYLMRDIAAFLERRKKYTFEKMIYVAPSKQDTHFKQLFAALELLDQDVCSKLIHIGFAKVEYSMPPTDSVGILLRDVLDHCQTAVKSHLEADRHVEAGLFADDSRVSNTLSVANLVTHCLAHRHTTNIRIDIDQITSTKSHSGISLHRWYAVLCSKLEGKVDKHKVLDNDDILDEEKYSDALRLLIQFPDVLRTSFNSTTLESSTVLTYLFRVTGVLSTLLEHGESPVEPTLNVAELALYESIRQVLENGIRILGMTPVGVKCITD
ncbi:hypothetical protein QQS21_004627 [Conoideocrella luteorostrata]|uniref:arginine--tRNA ligase n=1 Tax=Conoideocrella luteorostrata TaxID=1105319 RepID=A0AAJ0FVB4_9HYPO|nr:hypothetical protein QQS21_004627 [Conoideocrella luteorostrata]